MWVLFNFREQATIIKAIKALIYNPQNNLKVFKNGHYVYGEDCDMEKFESVIVSLFNTDNQEYERWEVTSL